MRVIWDIVKPALSKKPETPFTAPFLPIRNGFGVAPSCTGSGPRFYEWVFTHESGRKIGESFPSWKIAARAFMICQQSQEFCFFVDSTRPDGTVPRDVNVSAVLETMRQAHEIVTV
jgi:hypothetical protein